VASTRWITGPVQTVRYNGYPTMRISGDAAPGYATGDAIKEMQRLAEQLPAGFTFEWTGLSREELLSGSQAAMLLGFSMLAVFLCLAALYESWSIPFSVMLVVPLGVLGAVLGVTLRGMPNDVFFKVGLIAVIGLSAKNAILIIEFAKDLHASGKGLIEATLEACHLRFRAAAGGLVGRRLGEPARDRHRRDGRHVHRDRAGRHLRAGVLRGGPHLVQGQRASTEDVFAPTRRPAGHPCRADRRLA
jgi:Cu/Ag efflux pump CusA